jgi:hypothetical protein
MDSPIKISEAALLASDKHMVVQDAACDAVMIYIRSNHLPTGDLLVERYGRHYLIPEADWTFLLPDAADIIGRKNLSPEAFDRLNAFIGARKFRMREMGFFDSYPIPLTEVPPTEEEENLEDDQAEGEQP